MGLKNYDGSTNLLKNLKNTSKSFKRGLAVFCAAALIGTAVPVMSMSAMSAQAQDAIYASTTASLNVRKCAGMNYGVVKVLSKNTQVTIVDKTDSQWLKIKMNDGTEGYCSVDFLNVVTDAMTTTYLNMRKGPGTDYTTVKTIAPGLKLDILKFCGDSWANVKLPDGTTGYICTDYEYVRYLSDDAGETKVKTNASASVSNQSAASLKISDSAKTLSIGKNCTLTATTTSGGTFTWKSSDNSVATVTSKGVVTAVKTGKATITATDSKSSKSVSCTVTVTKAVLDRITLGSYSGTLMVGKSLTINPDVLPKNGKVSYKSSDNSVALVSSSGKVTAKRAGTCNITVYDPAGGSAKALYKLTVSSGKKITISSSSATVRQGAGVTLKASLSDNSAVKWTSSNTNVASVRGGVVSGIAPGTATITVSDSSGSVKATCRVTVTGVSSNGVSLSRYSGDVTAGKTLYIKGYSSSKCWWNSSDTNIATVYDGFILAKNPGKAAITYTDVSGNRAVCVVTVYDAYPIRFTYSSPNSATKNSNVSLIAITDKKRTNVRFDINVNGKNVVVYATKKVADGDTYVWTGTYRATQAGTFEYSAYSKTSGSSQWLTCSDGKADIYVAAKTDKKTTAVERLRASDDIIRFIGEKEGFVSYVTYDVLANNIPTLAHGYVVWEGDTFYNGLTRNEGYALLVSAVNKEVYARKVNDMLVSNNVRFNQQQFDALVSFSYNLGTGWTSSSDLKSILLNSYGTVSNSSQVTATVNTSWGLNLRESYTTNSKSLEVLDEGETVTLLSTQKYNSVWYKVRTASGKTGYCSGTYLTLHTGSTTGRDLNYVNKNALIKELLAYHHAGGVCYYGLLYRRVDEAEMFLYGDYVSDGRSNKYGFPSPYCLSF